jgi:anti-sigma factor RsiW
VAFRCARYRTTNSDKFFARPAVFLVAYVEEDVIVRCSGRADAACSRPVAMAGAAYASVRVFLTDRGKVLGPVLKAVYAWGERYG